MPDGKTFLGVGGVAEIVDVRAEEASAFAGPFARRSSQRLIARVALADAKDAIARVFIGSQSTVCSGGNRNRSKSATEEPSSSGCYGRPHEAPSQPQPWDAIRHHHSDNADRSAPGDTAQTLIPTNICTHYTKFYSMLPEQRTANTK